MKQILFRGKWTANGQWVYGGVCLEGDRADIVTSVSVAVKAQRVQPETVTQWTGFVDCEGKKVFDGDIVQANVGTTANPRRVFWDAEKGRWQCERLTLCQWISGCDMGFRVVGNIFDNPQFNKQ